MKAFKNSPEQTVALKRLLQTCGVEAPTTSRLKRTIRASGTEALTTNLPTKNLLTINSKAQFELDSSAAMAQPRLD